MIGIRLANQVGTLPREHPEAKGPKHLLKRHHLTNRRLMLFLLHNVVLITSILLVHQKPRCSGTAALMGDGRQVSTMILCSRSNPLGGVGYPNLLLMSICFSSSELVSSESRQINVSWIHQMGQRIHVCLTDSEWKRTTDFSHR